jgi:hypothetical protein
VSRATETLQAHAEVLKLARMLERDPDSLAYLEAVPIADLRALRGQITDLLWGADSGFIDKLAAAAKLLPTAVSATISERALGPLLSAQLAARLEPARAIDVASKLPTPFLAEIAIALDPRRTQAVIAGMPPRRIGEITAALIGGEEYVTMGQFVGHLDDEAIRAALNRMSNGALLRIGFVLEDKDRVERLVALLPEGRIEGILAAAAEHDLWLEALDLLSRLGAERRRHILESASGLDAATVEQIVATVVEHELWDEAGLIAAGDPALEARLLAARG